MRRMTYYRLCLLMPLLMPLPLVLGVDRATASAGLRAFIEALDGILRLGGIPYALLAALLFVRSFRWTSREMRRGLARAPFWMIPFQYVFTICYYIAPGNWHMPDGPADAVLGLLTLLLPVSVLTLLVGYFYILLAFALERIEERHGVLLPHDYPPREPRPPFRLTRMTYYRLWLPVPVVVSVLTALGLRRYHPDFQDSDFWLGAFFLFGVLPYFVVAAQCLAASFSLSARAMRDTLVDLPIRLLPWIAAVIFFFSIPTLGVLFLFAMPCAAIVDLVLGYSFVLIACGLERILERAGLLSPVEF